MKVAHIITGLKRGGAEKTLLSVISSDNGIEHIVISLGGMDYYGELCEHAGAKVFALNMKGVVNSFYGVIRLRSILKTEDCSVVQTWMYHANLLGGFVARTLSQRVIWNIRMTNPFSPYYSKKTQLVARISGYLSSFIPSAIVYCAHSSREMHEQNGYSRSKSVVVTNGYDLEKYRPNEIEKKQIRDKLNIPNSTIVFGAVGRYDPVKNYKGLIEALGLYAKSSTHSWCFLLIGSDMDSDNIELYKLVEGAGLQSYVKFIGPVAEIAPWHNAMDFLVSNSIDEGFPNVIAEAQACSTPAIVTDVGDSVRIIGENGWVISKNASEQLVEALQIAADTFNTEDYTKLSTDCRSRAIDLLSIEGMAEKYESIWKSYSDKDRS